MFEIFPRLKVKLKKKCENCNNFHIYLSSAKISHFPMSSSNNTQIKQVTDEQSKSITMNTMSDRDIGKTLHILQDKETLWSLANTLI